MTVNVAYFDCPTGLAGNMCLGALVDAGVPFDYIDRHLRSLGLTDEYRLVIQQVCPNGQRATQVNVELCVESMPGEQTDVEPDQGVSQPEHSQEQHADPDHLHPNRQDLSQGDVGLPAQIPTQTHGERSETIVPVAASPPAVHSVEIRNPQPHPHERSGHELGHSESGHGLHENLSPGSLGDENLGHGKSSQKNSDQGHPGHQHHSRSSHSGHDHSRPTRGLTDIEQMIQAAPLPLRVKQWSIAIFRTLAQAEGAVHGISPNQVHFHEVGATDAIVDIVGTCLGLDWLNIERVYCSALPTGGGTVWAAHGRLPVPAPAVLKLFELRQVPIYSNGIERELVTPTGAAIATTLATNFGPSPAMTLKRVGLGAGTLSLPIPNMVRLWIGEMADSSGAVAHRNRSSESSQAHSGGGVATSEAPAPQLGREATEASKTTLNSRDTDPSQATTVAVLETQIDDLSPQAIGYLFPVLLKAGALDVLTQPVGMKKCRPGVLLTVICRLPHVDACEAVIFRETTTLGIRRHLEHRTELHREIQPIQTPYGTIRLKLGRRVPQGPVINVQPEYEDCVRQAQAAGVSWLQVHQMAIAIYTHQVEAQGPKS